MRVFLTGATGFVGTAVARELRGAEHSVLGLARNDAAAAALAAEGVDAHRGELTDLESLAAGARACDGVIHCAFIHDFSRFMENMEIDRRAVEAMIDALAGSAKPFILTSGIAMVAPGRVATEADPPTDFGRGATETFAREAASRGVRTIVMRLPPSVHGNGDHGFVPRLIGIARDKNVSAYVGDGANRWAAGHRLDAARLYRRALEKAPAGTVLHAVGDEGVPTREIAAAIGRGLGLPVESRTTEAAPDHFGFLGTFFGMDIAASNRATQAELGWSPREPGLLADLGRGTYFDAQVAHAG